MARPGAIGRTVRFIFGALCLYGAYLVLAGASGFLTGRALSVSGIWIAIAFGLYVFADDVNIGFGTSYKRSHLLAGLAVLAGAATLATWAMYGSALGPPNGVFVFTWLLYMLGHLGVSFVLASFLGTPGCEMRSIPQLWALAVRRTAKEHYCPGVLTPIDRWERKLRGRRRGD